MTEWQIRIHISCWVESKLLILIPPLIGNPFNGPIQTLSVRFMTTPTIWKFSGSLDHSRSLGMLCLGGLGGNDFSKDLPNAVTFEVHLPQSNRENHHLLLTCFEAHHLWLLNLPPLSYLNKALPKPYFGGLGGGGHSCFISCTNFIHLGSDLPWHRCSQILPSFWGMSQTPKWCFCFPIIGVLYIHHTQCWASWGFTTQNTPNRQSPETANYESGNFG